MFLFTFTLVSQFCGIVFEYFKNSPSNNLVTILQFSISNTHVTGGGAGGVADGVGGVAGIHILRDGGVDVQRHGVVFRLLGDAGHGAHSLHGIFARGAFARKHDGGGAVKNGVGNVGDLRARGAGTDDHRFKHLRGGDDHLARLIAAADEALLQAGQTLVGDLNAHVAAGDHDAVAVFEDFVEMIDALFVFDFGNDADCMAAVIIEELAHVNDVLGGAHKGGGDEIHVMFDAKEQVALVLFAQIGHGQMHAGDVDRVPHFS